MTNSSAESAILHGNTSSLVLGVNEGVPQILYWGKRLSQTTTVEMLSLLQARQEVAASPTNEVPLGLSPNLGQGFTGHPGFSILGNQDQWAAAPTFVSIAKQDDTSVVITSKDATRDICFEHRISMDVASDVVTMSTRIINEGASRIRLDWCSAACFPVAGDCTEILSFEGHWANEFQTRHSSLTMSAFVRENRRGRTSHDSFPAIILHQKHTNQSQGEARGFHLGWSGNHKILAEQMADGRSYLQMGELLLPGEMSLEAGKSYQSPHVFASFSDSGLNGLSQQFHRYVRSNLIREQVAQKPRPVHYNTWEGLYFDHDMDTLKDLAKRASEVGVERFVLDDGWFPGRDDDTAGLGDWFVDKEKYPGGLTPLIDRVNELGMEFGLWFEPEMVNPDSELYRAHPDWVLSTPPNADTGFRNQLVLDLTNPDVFNYLFERLDTLLREYNIAYVKWDMNRDILQPGDANSQPAIHRQTKQFYALLDKVGAAHPNVEIESCASGGGRADYGVLAHTDRIWTSDSNDALNRLSIQRGFSYFLPSELMGSHVGPRDCHITHRHLSMGLRSATALFGHMGMEMDLRELNDEEKTQLICAVTLYKQHRELLHSGELFRLDMEQGFNGFGIVNEDKTQGLFSYTILNDHTASMPGMFRFAGLETDALYTLNVVWPEKGEGFWPHESLFHFDTNLPLIDGQAYSGEVLMNLGLQLPRLVPQTSLIFQLNKN